MLLSTRIKLVLALWFVGEALLFVLVAKLVGFALAFLLGVASSFWGVWLLKRAGKSAMMKLRAALDGRYMDDGPPGRVLDGMLVTIGALALVLPGFLSDLIGAALLVPAARNRLTALLDRRGFVRFHRGSQSRQASPSTIDLSPEEWHRSEPPQRRVSEI